MNLNQNLRLAEEPKRRRFARIPAKQLRCSLVSGGIASTNVAIVDISLGGAFLRTAEPLPVGESLSLEVPRSGQHQPLCLLGRVVFRKLPDRDPKLPAAQGIGVRFEDVDPITQSALRQLLQTLAPEVSLDLTEKGAGPGPGAVDLIPPAVRPVETAEVTRLKIQVQGLLMELGEAQNTIDGKEREIDLLQKAVVRLQLANAELVRKL